MRIKYKKKNINIKVKTVGVVRNNVSIGFVFFLNIYIFFFHRGDQWGDAERGC